MLPRSLPRIYSRGKYLPGDLTGSKSLFKGLLSSILGGIYLLTGLHRGKDIPKDLL